MNSKYLPYIVLAAAVVIAIVVYFTTQKTTADTGDPGNPLKPQVPRNNVTTETGVWKPYPGKAFAGNGFASNPKQGMTVAHMIAMAEHEGATAFFVPSDTVTSSNSFLGYGNLTIANPQKSVQFYRTVQPMIDGSGVIYVKE